MPNPLMPSAALRANGRFVRPFTADYGRHTIAPLGGAYQHLGAMADALVEKKQAVAADRNLSETGKREAILDFVKTLGAEALKKSADALIGARQHSETVLSQMTFKGVDKTDLAGAMVRGELRTWLRSLEPGQRTALVTMHQEMDPAVALAIAEAPAELSGVTMEQKHRLRMMAAEAQHPEKAQELRDLDKATALLAEAVSAAGRVIQEVTHLVPFQLDKIVGGDVKVSDIMKAGSTQTLDIE